MKFITIIAGVFALANFCSAAPGLTAVNSVSSTMNRRDAKTLAPLTVHGIVADANPITIPDVPAETEVIIEAISHAKNFQSVAIGGFPGEETITFQGTGENVPMTVVGSNPPATEFTFPPASISYDLTITFSFSTHGVGGPFQLSMVIEPTETGSIISFLTEDASDNDDNDTIFTIVLVMT